jgi:hypothetical protein
MQQQTVAAGAACMAAKLHVNRRMAAQLHGVLWADAA